MNPKDYTVLVAEDEEASLFLYQEELADLGYRVRTATNGLQVLGTLEDHPVDLLMTDVKMPDMHALEMVPRVRQDFPDLPILVVSAFRGMENEFALKEAKVAGFFTKPVDFKLLAYKINEILETRPPKAPVPAKPETSEGTRRMEPLKKTLLVAEDNEDLLKLFSEDLADAGFTVHRATNGVEVLEILRQQPVNLIVTDAKLPELNLLDILPQIRRYHPGLPVLVVTAYPSLREAFEDPEYRVEGFIVKPIQSKDLILKVRELLAAPGTP